MPIKFVLRNLYKQFVAPVLPKPLAYKLRYYSRHGYWPNLRHPRSLMEKVAWLLLFDRRPLRARVADRLAVREFVKELAPECKLPRHLWTGTNFGEKIWDSLPDEFVIKGNHGSQMTMIVDKSVHSYKDVTSAVQGWVDVDYSTIHAEWVYATAKHMLVVEEKLEVNHDIPPDWKFICGNGKVLLVQLDLGRFKTHTRNLYDRSFNLLKGVRIAYPPGIEIDKPSAYEKAVLTAEKLATPFDLIRVDLYIVGEDVYFGEMTNFPGAALDPLEPKSFDFEIGKQITLAAPASR